MKKQRDFHISKSETDKVQPWRVWNNKGNIIYFAKTLTEAKSILNQKVKEEK